jgi:hypothetical protein
MSAEYTFDIETRYVVSEKKGDLPLCVHLKEESQFVSHVTLSSLSAPTGGRVLLPGRDLGVKIEFVIICKPELIVRFARTALARETKQLIFPFITFNEWPF